MRPTSESMRRCKNRLLVEELKPCGNVLVYCKNCTCFYYFYPCVYDCVLTKGCKFGLENCIDCENLSLDGGISDD